MKKDVFEKALHHLLPDANVAGVDRWIDFATGNVSREQYIDFEPETTPVDQQAEVERWLGSLFAGLYQVEQTYGKEMAKKLWECGMHHSCLYSNEMIPMAEHLQKGGKAEDVGALINDGKLEASPPFFIKMEDVLPDDSPYWEKEPSSFEMALT